MNLCCIINTADNKKTALDTLESAKFYATDDVLLVIDGLFFDQYAEVDDEVKLKGYELGGPAPFRNIILGLKEACERFPDADWYIHCDYDVLFCSDEFKKHLEEMDEDIWMMGSDAHPDDKAMPLVSYILGEEIQKSHYILEACMFMRGHFVRSLNDRGFFQKFLEFTGGLPACCFPFYNGPDICEHMLPTLCVHYGGSVVSLSSYDAHGNWTGMSGLFPIRWKPQIEHDCRFGTSIAHPIKDCDHQARVYHRELRRKKEKNV